MILESTQSPGRWMALDLGSRSIGIAISDFLHITARPLTTIIRKNVDQDALRIAELANSNQVDKIIIGKPVHLDGSESKVLDSFLPLIQKIRGSAGNAQVVLAEERLSSKEAESLMAKLRIPISQRRKRRDEIAAALILSWYIEDNSIDR
jgi:putative Holliday junction resolvase